MRAQKRCSTSSGRSGARTGSRRRSRRNAATGRRCMPRRPKIESRAGWSVSRGEERDDREQEAADPDRADERERHEDQQREPDRDRRPGEDHRAAGRLHRPHDRRLDLQSVRQLLAEAVDDQQGVVDRDPEPDQEDQVRDVRRHGDEVRDHVDERERPEHRAGREQERDQSPPRTAPKTSRSTTSAIGRAIDSPFARSRLKIGSRSCWIAGRAGDVRLRAGRLPDRADEVVRTSSSRRPGRAWR